MNNMKFLSAAMTCLIALGGVDPNAGRAESFQEAIQNYLDEYQWKGLIENEATSGPVTLKYLELNEHSRAAIVKPGERIDAEVKCIVDPEQVSAFRTYRVVIGIKGEGAQTVIGNELGLTAGTSLEKFTLIAPVRPGIYEIRFKPVEAFFASDALDAWEDAEGNEPDAKTTIGLIVVK